MVNATEIREHMPVVGSDTEEIGRVDRVEGNAIKLTKDERGQHHWLPLEYVASVDDKVHLSCTGSQAQDYYLSNPPRE